MSDMQNELTDVDVPEVKPVDPPFAADKSLTAVLEKFKTHMRDEGFAINTSKAFASDIRLLGKHLGAETAVGDIGTKDLNDFLDWLLYERGVPCSPKSYARRVTTLKVFFSWLQDIGVRLDNPADAVIQRSVKSPLPTPPSEADLEKALVVTEEIRQGATGKKPDARPHMLLTLLLQTGIKKGEAMSMEAKHINREKEGEPELFVRYVNPRLRYKERKVPLASEWLEVFDEYMNQYNPDDTVFTCTARNLEYILRDVGDAAGLEKGSLSFENLRWAAALRDWRHGEEPDDIRQKLGLSKITWRETRSKIEQLIEKEQTTVSDQN